MAWNQFARFGVGSLAGAVLWGMGGWAVMPLIAWASGEEPPPETFAPLYEPVTGEAASPETASPNEDQDPLEEFSESAPEVLPLEETFPTDLIGQDIQAVLSTLVAEGWILVVYTPRLAQLDRDQLGLDLYVNPPSGRIIEAEVIDLF